ESWALWGFVSFATRRGRCDLILRITKIDLVGPLTIHGAKWRSRSTSARNCQGCDFGFFNRIHKCGRLASPPNYPHSGRSGSTQSRVGAVISPADDPTTG